MPFLHTARAVWSRPYALLTLAAAGWAGNAIAGRLSVGIMSPMVMVTLRWFIVLVVLAFATRRVTAPDWAALGRRWRYVLLMGGLGFTVFNAMFYWAAHYTSAVNMGVVQGATPGLVLLGTFFAYGTPIRTVQVLGIATSVVGVVIMASHGDVEVLRHLAFNLGDVAIFLCSAMYAGYTIGLRRRPDVPPLAFFSGLALAAFLTSLPLLAWEVASGAVLWPDGRGWALIVFIALGPSLGSQLFFMRGVELIGPSRAGLFTNVIPVFAAVMGVAILGEAFGLSHAIALLCVLGGIWVAERGRATPQPS